MYTKYIVNIVFVVKPDIIVLNIYSLQLQKYTNNKKCTNRFTIKAFIPITFIFCLYELIFIKANKNKILLLFATAVDEDTSINVNRIKLLQ